jgi:hypothetical protein
LTLSSVALSKAEAINEASTAVKGEDANELHSRLDVTIFGEGPANLVISIKPSNKSAFEKLLPEGAFALIGEVTGDKRLRLVESPSRKDKSALATKLDLTVEQLAAAWTTKLPFD